MPSLEFNRTLVTRRGSYLENFEVDFRYDECFAHDVDVWLEFALKSNVNEVALRLISIQDFYTLPQVMHSSSSLTSLWMVGCIMAAQRTMEWRSLTELDIGEVELLQRVIEVECQVQAIAIKVASHEHPFFCWSCCSFHWVRLVF